MLIAFWNLFTQCIIGGSGREAEDWWRIGLSCIFMRNVGVLKSYLKYYQQIIKRLIHRRHITIINHFNNACIVAFRL